MARTVTLEDLRNRSLRRADLINSSFRTDAEVDEIVNAERRKVYDLRILADGEWALSSADSVTVSQQDAYALPSDFYKLKGVDAFLSGTGGAATPMRQYRWDDRNRFQYSGGWTIGEPLAYRLRGSYLVVAPKPSGGITFRVWYFPVLSELTLDADTIDVTANEDELITVGTGAVLAGEEGDTEREQALKAEWERLKEAYLSNIIGRDAGAPTQAHDIYTAEDWSG